jgi:hypothetical protein
VERGGGYGAVGGGGKGAGCELATEEGVMQRDDVVIAEGPVADFQFGVRRLKIVRVCFDVLVWGNRWCGLWLQMSILRIHKRQSLRACI